MTSTWKIAGALITAVAAMGNTQAAPVGVDGTIGAEWGAPTSTVGFDSTAPSGNFGSPGTTNNNVAYSIYLRSDDSYLYGAVKAAGATNGQDYANIYLNVDGLPNPGSDLGLEVTNDRFFRPGISGYTNDTSGLLIFATGAGVIEFAIDWSMLLDDTYGMGFNKATSGGTLLMTLSQSFGLSVAGGTSYGVNRLGAVTVPNATQVDEPGVLAMTGLALALLGISRRRRRA